MTTQAQIKPQSPYWQEAHRKAKEIPPMVTPDKERRKSAIHAFWQAILRAIREDRQ